MLVTKMVEALFLVPTGTWLTAPIEIKKQCEFTNAAKGATIQFTTDHTQYPIIKNG